MKYELGTVYSVESYDPNIKFWLVIPVKFGFESFKEFFDTDIILQQQYKEINPKHLIFFNIESLDKNSKLYKTIKLRVNVIKLNES
jgi:hypothetical protein